MEHIEHKHIIMLYIINTRVGLLLFPREPLRVPKSGQERQERPMTSQECPKTPPPKGAQPIPWHNP